MKQNYLEALESASRILAEAFIKSGKRCWDRGRGWIGRCAAALLPVKLAEGPEHREEQAPALGQGAFG